MPISPGTRLGPYEITSPVGAGGMGEVYRAVDTRLDRAVAVKILPSDFAANAQLRLRFEREAKVISSLTHPNICTLHDVGESNGFSFLVMELLDGETLADRIGRGPLPLAQVLAVSMQIASALENAHRQGIVHRDLKPANIMLTKSGVKLLDFGLAKSAGLGTFAAEDATQHKSLTAEGTIVGTFQYMAPEQLEGQEVDARTDIFAFGAVMYEMATGKRAFEGKTRTSLIAAIVQGQPAPISAVQPLTPPAFERLVAACLAKDPEQRIQSAHDVLLQLQWIVEEKPAAQPTNRRAAVPWIAAGLVTALVAGGLGWGLRHEKPRPGYSFTIPAVSPQYRFIGAVLVSPDGMKLAFSARDAAGQPYLWVQHLDSFEVRRLDPTENATVVCWSPDSKFLFFSKGGTLSRIPADGGAVEKVAAHRAISGEMSPDGVLLVTVYEGPLMRVDTATGDWQPVTVLDRNQKEYTHGSPRFLPDGRRFLYVGRTTAGVSGAPKLRLYAGSLDGEPARFLGEVPSAVAFADPGYVLYVSETVLMARPFDPVELRFTGEPRAIMDGVAQNIAVGIFSVSHNGVLVARPPRRQATIRRVDRSGQSVGQIGEPDTMGSIRIAPDGERVAATRADPKAGTFDIWAHDLRRPTQQRIVTNGAHDQLPVWSRDGSQIYFASDRDGYPDIFVTSSDGAGEARRVVGGPGSQYPYDISPDGAYLVYASFNAGNVGGSDLYALPLAGGQPRLIAGGPRTQGNARLSPDGRLLAYLSDESGVQQPYVRPFPGPGRARQISTAAAVETPVWAADGRTLFFLNARKMMAIEIDPATGVLGGEPSQLFELPYEAGSFDVAPDGTFLITMGTEERDVPPVRIVTDWQRLLRD